MYVVGFYLAVEISVIFWWLIHSDMQLTVPYDFAKKFKSSLFFYFKKIMTLSLLLQQHLPLLFNDKLHVARIATSHLGVLLRNLYKVHSLGWIYLFLTENWHSHAGS